VNKNLRFMLMETDGIKLDLKFLDTGAFDQNINTSSAPAI